MIVESRRATSSQPTSSAAPRLELEKRKRLMGYEAIDGGFIEFDDDIDPRIVEQIISEEESRN